jgi:alpha-beta hydrolase superfamily lysophospholipase
MLGKSDVLDANPDARVLVVMLHGFDGSPAQFSAIRDHVIGPALGAADVFIPALPYHRILCTVPMADIIADVAKRIDALWAKKREASDAPYERIVLVGFSLGSQAARALWVHAWGADGSAEPAAGEPLRPRYAWARDIRRIVLLAGLNRGISFDAPLAGPMRVWWSLVHVLGAVREPTIFSLRRGSPFLTELRLQWLELWPRLGRDAPVVVQLLGTQDDLVDPADNLDLYAGREFHYLEVGLTGHLDILDVTGKGDVHRRNAARKRAELVGLALTGDEATLQRAAIPKDQLGDPADLEETTHVEDVVFVVHGMRDYGFWTQKIGREIRRRGGDRVRVVSPSYGYFPILPFALPWVRRRKVDWLMDKYVEVRKRYPNAAISYVGHSNGTYLLARALQDYPSVAFKHVVFAGSCVRTNYEWSKLKQGRLQALLNFVATADWVVALFGKGLQPLRAFDLGAAGHDGFRDPQPVNFKFVSGRHGAGINEHHWDDIAEFILRGTKPELSDTPELRKTRRHLAVIALGLLSTLLLLIGAGAIVAGAVALFSSAVLGHPAWLSDTALGTWLVAHPAAASFLFVGYLAALRFVLLRL